MSSEDRKRKLAEIRAKANKESAPVVTDVTAAVEAHPATDANESEEVAEKKLKFRNYQPYDTSLKKLVKETEVKENSSVNLATPLDGRVETDVIKLELQKFQDEELNIMPKKPNWDLKVQVEGKLEKLKNRTQKAIVEILREKLAAEASEE